VSFCLQGCREQQQQRLQQQQDQDLLIEVYILLLFFNRPACLLACLPSCLFVANTQQAAPLAHLLRDLMCQQ